MRIRLWAQQRESVKRLPERLSRRNRTRVPKLSSSYRNPMVKHEPELHSLRGNLIRSGRHSASSRAARMSVECRSD